MPVVSQRESFLHYSQSCRGRGHWAWSCPSLVCERPMRCHSRRSFECLLTPWRILSCVDRSQIMRLGLIYHRTSPFASPSNTQWTFLSLALLSRGWTPEGKAGRHQTGRVLLRVDVLPRQDCRTLQIEVAASHLLKLLCRISGSVRDLPLWKNQLVVVEE